jgi:hypothetical protein
LQEFVFLRPRDLGQNAIANSQFAHFRTSRLVVSFRFQQNI